MTAEEEIRDRTICLVRYAEGRPFYINLACHKFTRELVEQFAFLSETSTALGAQQNQFSLFK